MNTHLRGLRGLGVLCSACLLVALSSQASAQTSRRFCDPWGLQNRGYYDPLLADIRGANVSAMVWGRADAFTFTQQPGVRRVWDINVGKEIPIVGCESGSGNDAPLAEGRWGIGLWTPVSIHMVEDFKDESNPILNTDYRFSGMVKFQRGLSETWQLGARFQAGHESTHLGDEFSLAGRRVHPDFERVNVSYEYWEYGVSVDHQTDSDEPHRFVLRYGGIGLFDGEKGYYDSVLLEPPGRRVTKSVNNFEHSLGFQWIHDRTIPRLGPFGPFVSADLRLRTVYSYHKASDTEPDPTQPSLNLLVGIRRVERRFLEKGLPDIFFRFYQGVNPNGQFRSQRRYTQYGVGIIVEL